MELCGFLLCTLCAIAFCKLSVPWKLFRQMFMGGMPTVKQISALLLQCNGLVISQQQQRYHQQLSSMLLECFTRSVFSISEERSTVNGRIPKAKLVPFDLIIQHISRNCVVSVRKNKQKTNKNNNILLKAVSYWSAVALHQCLTEGH